MPADCDDTEVVLSVELTGVSDVVSFLNSQRQSVPRSLTMNWSGYKI